MSLDMTIETREAVLASGEDAIEDVIDGHGAEDARLWRQELALVLAGTFGVLVSSAMAVLLFLR